MKENINKLTGLHQNLNFCYSNYTVEKMKTQATDRKKIFAKHNI